MGSDRRGGNQPARGVVVRTLLVVLARPSLWRAVARLVPPGWWRRWPPRPWPPPDYIRYRTQTMYGDRGRPEAGELIAYLEWCRRMGHRAR
jgi:hypothetical protein